MMIKALRGNASAGVGGAAASQTMNLGRLTLILGKNGAGKSRWLHTAGLALTHATDDLVLRRVKLPATLAVMAPAGAETLWAEAEFDDDAKSVAKFVLNVGDKVSVNKKQTSVPSFLPAPDAEVYDSVLPMRGIHDALRKGPEAARELLLPYIVPGGKFSVEEMERRLGSDWSGAAVAPVVEPATPTTVAELRARIALCGEISKEKKAEAKASNDLAEAGAARIQGADPTDDVLAGARRLVLVYQRLRERMLAQDSTLLAQQQAQRAEQEAAQLRAMAEQAAAERRQQLAMVTEQYSHGLQNLAAYDQWLASAPAQLDQLAPDPGPMPVGTGQEFITTARAHAEQLARYPEGCTCYSCGQATSGPYVKNTVLPYLEKLEADLKAQVAQQVAAWNERVSYRATLLRQIEETRQARMACAQHVEQLRAQGEWLSGSGQGPAPVGVPSPMPVTVLVPPEVEVPPGVALPTTLTEADQLIESAVAAEIQAQALRTQWTSVREHTARANAAAKTLKWWTDYEVELQRVIGELFATYIGGFLEQAQSYMPAGWRIHLQLRDTQGHDVFLLGLRTQGGELHMAPSGKQLETCEMAFTVACLERRPEGPPTYALLMFTEDRGWDGETLQEWMKACTNIPDRYQILAVTTTPPTGHIPKEWTVRNVDGTPWVRAKPKKEKSEKPEKSGEDDLGNDGAEASIDPKGPPPSTPGVPFPPMAPPPALGSPPNPLTQMGHQLGMTPPTLK